MPVYCFILKYLLRACPTFCKLQGSALLDVLTKENNRVKREIINEVSFSKKHLIRLVECCSFHSRETQVWVAIHLISVKLMIRGWKLFEIASSLGVRNSLLAQINTVTHSWSRWSAKLSGQFVSLFQSRGRHLNYLSEAHGQMRCACTKAECKKPREENTAFLFCLLFLPWGQLLDNDTGKLAFPGLELYATSYSGLAVWLITLACPPPSTNNNTLRPQ